MSAATGRPGGPLTVAVLAGGRSSEHDVSLASAASVRDGLLAAGHEVLWVDAARDGAWRHEGREVALRAGGGLLRADVVFPALHGPFGEDGTVQGMLEILDVAYVGAGVAASAVCMDKVMFKDLMAASGTPQVAYAAATRERWRAEQREVEREVAVLGPVVFVKPAHLGSSVGIARVASAQELAPALEQAFAHDRLVIVEAASNGTEVECGVLGSAAQAAAGVALASDPGEIVISGQWYDYAAKYSPGGMELRLPARITDAARARVKELALRAFAASGCEGLARADFFVEGEHVLLNELNTMPGFTPTSVYAKLLAASGVAYPDLVDRLCRLALERHAAERAVRH